jgi:hypothetical protein
VGDGGVVEGGEQPGLTLEPRQALGILRQLGRQHLDCHGCIFLLLFLPGWCSDLYLICSSTTLSRTFRKT